MNRIAALLLIFCVSLTPWAMGGSPAHHVRTSAFAVKDRLIRARVENEPGAVVVRLASGRVRQFPAGSSTDAARGAALNAAFLLGPALRNSTVFLGPGTYAITSGLRGYSGSKLYGSGRNATTIKMADGSLSLSYFVFRCVESENPKTGYRRATGCELRDVTLDVNRQNQLPGQFFGVGAQLMSSNAILSHVTCKNAGGNTYDELFCLSIVAAGGVSGSFNTGLVTNALVEECEVDSIAPGFGSTPIAITPIVINGSYTPDIRKPGDGWVVGGRITNCAVHGITSEAGLLAFQVSAASLVAVENCSTYDNHSRFVVGFYTDTGPLHRVRILRNRFADVDIGVRLLCDSASLHSGTLIFANDIQFRSDGPAVAKGGVEYSGNSRTSGVRVLANRMISTLGLSEGIGVHLNQVSGAFILVNTIDGFPTPVGLEASDDTVVRENRDSAGLPIADGFGQ